MSLLAEIEVKIKNFQVGHSPERIQIAMSGSKSKSLLEEVMNGTLMEKSGN